MDEARDLTGRVEDQMVAKPGDRFDLFILEGGGVGMHLFIHLLPTQPRFVQSAGAASGQIAPHQIEGAPHGKAFERHQDFGTACFLNAVENLQISLQFLLFANVAGGGDLGYV